MYKGITAIGMGNYSALYSATEQFGDGFSRGLQHLFSEDYTFNLVKMGVTLNKFPNKEICYGNVSYNGNNAPEGLEVIEEGNEKIYDVFTKYKELDGIVRKSRVYGLDKAIVFEEELSNLLPYDVNVDQYAYAFLNNNVNSKLYYDIEQDCIIWSSGVFGKELVIGLQLQSSKHYLSEEPKYTALVTLQKILGQKLNDNIYLTPNSKQGASAAIGSELLLKAKATNTFTWYMIPCRYIEEGINVLRKLRNVDIESHAEMLHKGFFKTIQQHSFKNETEKRAFCRNLLAIKAVNLNGMVPADMIGHYFSRGTPSFYVRDSLMVARAFLTSGYLTEAEQIIKAISDFPNKTRGEFYQRYNAEGKPSEGLNNDIEHQMDSNGYFLSLIYQYYKRTGKLLITLEKIEDLVDFIKDNQTHQYMVGPEGGVNEGVYGAAYITSTNMFITGGLYHTQELLGELKGGEAVNPLLFEALKREVSELIEKLELGIDHMWDDEFKYYRYGFSSTCGSVVDRYDTPQYFSVLYGYKNNDKLRANNEYLLKHAAFYNDGIGYSQQSYHHGPWIFNTAACAQYNFLYGNLDEYDKKLEWIFKHLNAFGLAPEAISADDEEIALNNPLTWACAELVSAIATKWRL